MEEEEENLESLEEELRELRKELQKKSNGYELNEQRIEDARSITSLNEVRRKEAEERDERKVTPNPKSPGIHKSPVSYSYRQTIASTNAVPTERTVQCRKSDVAVWRTWSLLTILKSPFEPRGERKVTRGLCTRLQILFVGPYITNMIASRR